MRDELPQATKFDKTWAVVSDDEILLEAETRPQLERLKETTDIPDGTETVALPKPYKSVIV